MMSREGLEGIGHEFSIPLDREAMNALADRLQRGVDMRERVVLTFADGTTRTIFPCEPRPARSKLCRTSLSAGIAVEPWMVAP
jgi:hypothetical protein